jgi:hypothetical protein
VKEGVSRLEMSRVFCAGLMFEWLVAARVVTCATPCEAKISVAEAGLSAVLPGVCVVRPWLA